MPDLDIEIDPGLDFFQKKGRGGGGCDLHRMGSVKDMVEARGIPHTEVGRLYWNGRDVDFSFVPRQAGLLKVFPVTPPLDPLTPSLLRPRPLKALRFVADVNVGKLAVLLRAAGFDTRYENTFPDNLVADISERENRIVLSKDLQLLKRKKIVFGRYVRSVLPDEQFGEIIRFFGLKGPFQLFSRCLVCNGLLEPVSKESVLSRLKPRTKKYYHRFSRCPVCDKIYWQGSHYEKIKARVRGLGG